MIRIKRHNPLARKLKLNPFCIGHKCLFLFPAHFSAYFSWSIFHQLVIDSERVLVFLFVPVEHINLIVLNVLIFFSKQHLQLQHHQKDLTAKRECVQHPMINSSQLFPSKSSSINDGQQ